MKILEVSRYKDNFADHQLPFVTEQGESLRLLGEKARINVEYFLVKGNYLKAAKELRAKIEEVRPDIVHAHYGLSGITASLACTPLPFEGKGTGKGLLVTTFHNGEWHNWWVNLLSSLFARRAKHLIYVAPHVREKMYFKHPHYSILPCGVNMQECTPIDYKEARKQLGWEDNTKYILFGGAFSNKRKNVQLLREALALVTPHFKVEVVEMKGLSRAECVLRMSACDLFALPTKNEGSPQALKEAMTCNCPIVATDCADIAYLLDGICNMENGKCGMEGHYLLSNKGKSKAEWVGDNTSVEELAELLKAALSLPCGFRTEGRERIIELGYTNEDIAKKLIEIYHGVLK